MKFKLMLELLAVLFISCFHFSTIESLETCPQNAAFSADTKILYVTYEDLKAITPIILESGQILPSIQLQEVPQSLLISPDGKKAFTTHLRSNKISVINLESGILESIILAEEPLHSIVLASDGMMAYIISAKAITPFNLNTGHFDSPILLKLQPENIFHPDLSDQILPALTLTRTILSSQPNPVFVYQEAIFTADVRPRNARGAVTFFDGDINLGSARLNRRGEAILRDVRFARIGNHEIIAHYQGEGNFLSSVSQTYTQFVGAEGVE